MLSTDGDYGDWAIKGGWSEKRTLIVMSQWWQEVNKRIEIIKGTKGDKSAR